MTVVRGFGSLGGRQFESDRWLSRPSESPLDRGAYCAMVRCCYGHAESAKIKECLPKLSPAFWGGAAEVPSAAAVRTRKPDEVERGRCLPSSAPLVESATGGLTWNALLEASSEAFELSVACSGSSGKPIEASTRPFEVPGRAREASSTLDEASSGAFEASRRAFEASTRAFEVSSEPFEASTKALEMGLKLCNPSTGNDLRVLVLRMIPGSLMTQLLHVTDGQLQACLYCVYRKTASEIQKTW